MKQELKTIFRRDHPPLSNMGKKQKWWKVKKRGAELPYYWTDAYITCRHQRKCLHCENFRGEGGCREEFGEKTEQDTFCRWKKSKFWRPK